MPFLQKSSLRLAVLLALAATVSTAAEALTLNVSFTRSTYAVQAGDTYADLLAEHNAGLVLGGGGVTSLDGVSTAVHAPGNTNDYSVLMSVDLVAAQSGSYEFQAGVDWGRGGIAAVVNNTTSTVISEYVRTDDLWWAHNWNHGDVFTTQVNLVAGESYSMVWIGFEGCCAGSSTIRFAFEGAPFAPITAAALAPHAAVSEPAFAWFVGTLAVLAGPARRKILALRQG